MLMVALKVITTSQEQRLYINENVSTLNKFTDLKNNSHWGYYGILEAANDHFAVSHEDTELWVK